MPTSNGQVGRYDIRREAVHTDHIVNDAVETDKIPDLAVTFPDKIDDPIWVTSFESNPGLNPTLTTTFQEVASVDVDVPAWVDSISVLSIGQWQMTNTSGGNVDLLVSTRVNDSDDGARQATVANNTNGLVAHVENSNLAGVAGATFQVSVYAAVSSGTNSTNNGACWGFVVGRR